MGRHQVEIRALLCSLPPAGFLPLNLRTLLQEDRVHIAQVTLKLCSWLEDNFLLLSYFKITFQIYASPKTHLKHSTAQDTAKGKSQLKSGPDCSFQMSRKTHCALWSTNTGFFLVLVSGDRFSLSPRLVSLVLGNSPAWLPSVRRAEITGMHMHYTSQCFNSLSAASRHC